MKSFLLLLFLSTAKLIICSQVQKVKLLPEVLKPDLEAIAKYHENIDKHIDAFIHWPHNIDFYVGKEEIDNEEYLKLVGRFEMKSLAQTYRYDNLYFKDGKFYVQATAGMFPIEHNTKFHYKQETFPKEKNEYLSISYRNLDEVKAAVALFQSKYRDYLHTYTRKSPTSYLATWGSPTENFLEYTRWNNGGDQEAIIDGGLHILIGKVKKNKVSVTELGVRSSKLVFNPKDETVTIPTGSGLKSVQKVFGVRMASVGFLAVKRGKQVKNLSFVDLAFKSDEDPSGHQEPAGRIVRKAAMVEPKQCARDDLNCIRDRPEVSKFQVQGHILVKMVNYLEDGKSINEECPFLIDYAERGPDFQVGATVTKQICTDDEKLWPANNEKSSYDPEEHVVLFYQ